MNNKPTKLFPGEKLISYLGSSEALNVTPHEIAIYFSNGRKIIIPPSGIIARLVGSQHDYQTEDIMDIPVIKIEPGVVRGLPKPRPGVWIIASSMIAQVVKRSDVISPNTITDPVKDPFGHIIGVRSFLAWA